MTTAEHERLQEADSGAAPWRLWGPYLAERQWGTVREDYSPDGDAWNYFPHDHARSRAYRWGEDGLLGICDEQARLCFALALWNGRDPILKERLFGLTGPQGNHGEDVKECYFYLDATPSGSYLKALYKYPQAAYPYTDLVRENGRRGRLDPEYELIDTGIFAEDRYFDVQVEYAKAGPQDMLIRLTASNRGPERATLDLLPTLWFRNTWSWGEDPRRPELAAAEVQPAGHRLVAANHFDLGGYWLACDGAPELLFTENESDYARLYNVPNRTPFVKDGINAAVVDGRRAAVNPALLGTKVAARYALTLAGGASATVLLRLSAEQQRRPFDGADALFGQRIADADAFYATLAKPLESDDLRAVQRQAFAGLLWSKQFYCYDISRWLEGDPAQPAPPPQRRSGRNRAWRRLNNAEILSMPDSWEYPWYASWDLAFHCLSLVLIDPQFAKSQLLYLTREWYMHPNGQLPAYEWAFGDVNPPVHAWAAWRVYRIEQRTAGVGDRAFLERVFHKLLLNFTWWVNRKDPDGLNVFEGGFLGLDNIGVFDRSMPLPSGEQLEQSDGTSWMGMYSLNMLAIALELARADPVYEDIATKFLEHFLYIAQAMNNIAGEGIALWDDEDEFFYDVLHLPDAPPLRMRVRSLVGLIPLFAVETIEPETLALLPEFGKRLDWLLANKPDLASLVSRWQEPGAGERRLLALTRGHRLKCLLRRALDPNEFLSDYGIRGLSKVHADAPFRCDINGVPCSVDYEPGESTSGLFGGNSNWRGPVWFPVNYLLIEALQRFQHYFGDDFTVECPTGSGTYLTLGKIADELSRRLIGIFTRAADGRRPFLGDDPYLQTNPHWRDYILFYEYFHGDSGKGLGASHQTGWTGLVAKLIEQQGRVLSGEL